MADFRNTIRQVNYAYAHKKNSTGQLAPNNNIGYGPWDSLQEAWTNLLAIFGNEASLIPIGITVGINTGDNTITDYWLQGGHTQANLVEKGSSSVDIVDDLTHTDTNKALSANQGKVLKDMVDANKSSLSSLKAEVAALGTNTDVPVVIPETAVVLPTSTTLEYDADDTYVISINSTNIATVHYPYEHTDNGTLKGYLVFKAIDRDLYYVYEHTTGNYYSPLEQVEYNNLSHSEAQAIFKAGQYAVKQIIDVNGKNGDAGTPSPKGYWEHGVPSVFATFHGYPLRYNQIYETPIDAYDNGYHVLLKCDEINKIFKYRVYTSEPSPNTNNVKTGCWYLAASYSKGNANYATYDVYFDRQPASNISFDDSITQLGTQEHPVDNVQLAIQALGTNISSMLCTLTIQLYKDSSLFSGKEIDVTIKHAGEINTTLSGTYTTVNGIVTLSIPLGNTYTIECSSEVNYITPSTIEGIADSLTKTVSAIYSPVSENEREILICLVRNSSSLPTGKVAYIDYMNSDYSEELSHEEFTITFGSDGKAAIIVNKTHGTVSYCDIPFGTYYRVRLADWDTSEEQVFVPSSPYLGRATKDINVINLRYTYSLSGLFLVVKDTYESAFGYSSYLVTGINSENNVVTIKIGSSNYDIKYQAGTGILKSPSGEDNYTTWYASADIDSNIIGIGVRNQTLINSPLLDTDGIAQNYTNCCVMICKGVTSIQKAWTIKGILDDHDGKFGTNNTASEETVSPAARDTKAITKVTGNHTQTAFIPSNYQAKAILYNIDDINVVASCVNMSVPAIKTGTWWTSSDWSSAGAGSIDIWSNGQYGGNYTSGVLTASNYILPVFCFN